MCPDYYILRQKLEEICQRPAKELDTMALAKIKADMSAHIKSCPVCQENMDWARNQAHKPQEYIDDDV